MNRIVIKRVIENNLKLIHNFGYLFLLRFISILLPLVTYPYLIRVLGSDLYGTVLYAQAIIMYFSLIINFGFNITGTKEVAENINDNVKLSEIVSSIYLIKFFLFIVSFLLLLFTLCISSALRDISILVTLSFSACLNELLFPQWYFQGVDKMKYITILNVFSKILFTVLIFFIINTKNDYLFIPIIIGFGVLLSGVISVYILIFKEKITFHIPQKAILIFYFRESLPLFISAASVQVYVNANKVLVGVFLGMNEVAYYDLGEKVLNVIKIPVGMLGQAAFPTLTRLKSIHKINKIMLLGVIMTLVLIVFIFVFSENIVILLGSLEMLEAVEVMRILAISAIMVALSQFLGTSRLIIFGYKKTFTKIIASSGVFFTIIILVIYFSDNLNLNSLAWSAVAVECWVTLLMLIASYKYKLLVE
ncbi:oligosaccharide flippase family protein [Polaribacter sp. ALD11]|uniref:oligosaccharide flippase family protein n=1 Tax=Polaribacter sp. ALD11 TaxID=2058137 RepID=UPI0012FE4814|nr:oligosaccharide flippase family protein [Polaribacter sp. ALD11]